MPRKQSVLGSSLAYKELPENARLVLIGDQEQITDPSAGIIPYRLKTLKLFMLPSKLAWENHPIKAFSQKTDSSIVVGFKLLKTGMIDSFASAGNTGAMMVGAMQVIKSIPGVIRPAIAAAMPRMAEKPMLLLDVGINPDCRPDVLYQYAILGKIYARDVFGITEPRIGLLNIGSEDEKGNLLTKSTFQAMKDTPDFNFFGNVEGNDLFGDKVDVMVCDGFVGNVMLKEAEAFYSLIRKRKIKDPFFEKFNFVNYGGTPILGINAPVMIAHGISNDIAIKNLILHSIDVVKADITEKIKEAFK